MSEADPEPGIEDPARSAYYADARSWAEDAQAERDRSRRFAWRVTAAAATIAALEALALIALVPLKTVVAYTLLVDRNTGFVEALDPTHPLSVQPQAALTQSLLAQYVVARETFDIAGLPQQYQKVALWSADAARRDYLNLMTPGNAEGPLARYPRSAVVQTHVESVSPVAPDAALVRFYTEQSDPDQGPKPRAYWAAVVRYRYSGEPMTLADRLVNPLGFQVVTYRRDQEAPPPETMAPPRAALPYGQSNGGPPTPATPLSAAPGVSNGPQAGAPVDTRPAYPHMAAPAAAGGVVQTL